MPLSHILVIAGWAALGSISAELLRVRNATKDRIAYESFRDDFAVWLLAACIRTGVAVGAATLFSLQTRLVTGSSALYFLLGVLANFLFVSLARGAGKVLVTSIEESPTEKRREKWVEERVSQLEQQAGEKPHARISLIPELDDRLVKRTTTLREQLGRGDAA